MTEQERQVAPGPQPEPTRPWVVAAVMACLAMAALLGLVLAYYFWFSSSIGPAQPISFSHRFHVTQKRISCLFCHNGVLEGPRAGIPPLETCMLCHRKIIVTHPQIAKLTQHYNERRPVEWVKVNSVPNFVYFNHERHIRAGYDCGRCHGDVAQMDRVALVHDLKMGFCIQCHRDEGFSHDCYICHR